LSFFFEKIWLSFLGGMAATLAQGLWYVLLACLSSAIFYVWFRRLWKRHIASKPATATQINWEIVYSMRTVFVFGGVAAFMSFALFCGWTRIYWRVADYGWTWFLLSIPAMIFLHDTYFYWMHRLLHHPRLFRRVHRVHHLSVSPSPWSGYSVSTLEALVLGSIGPIIVFVLPVHPLAFTLFMGWQIAFTVFAHGGYEIFPQRFLRTWLGRLLITPTHHVLHHEKPRTNFGLYFSIWDRLAGTTDPDYEERFARVTSRETASYTSSSSVTTCGAASMIKR
jgi:sterol desaturase/sphingolipid hydroxylase (fatty acid hydroxylase superfamily)